MAEAVNNGDPGQMPTSSPRSNGAGRKTATGRRLRPVPAHPSAPDTSDERVAGMTVSFQVRYVHGSEADRVSAAQARAIAALLRWAATAEQAAGNDPDQHSHGGTDSDEGQERAA